jgi:hypothetical protein
LFLSASHPSKTGAEPFGALGSTTPHTSTMKLLPSILVGFAIVLSSTNALSQDEKPLSVSGAPPSAVFTTDPYGSIDSCCGVNDSIQFAPGTPFTPHDVNCNQFLVFIDPTTGSRDIATNCPVGSTRSFTETSSSSSDRQTTFSVLNTSLAVTLDQKATSPTQLTQTYTLTNTGTATRDLILLFFSDSDLYYSSGGDDPNGWSYNLGRQGPVPSSVTILESGHQVRVTLTSALSSPTGLDHFDGWRIAQFHNDNETRDYESAGTTGFPAAHLNGIFHSPNSAPDLGRETSGDANCDGLTDDPEPTCGSTQWRVHFDPAQETRTFVVTTDLASGPDPVTNPPKTQTTVTSAVSPPANALCPPVPPPGNSPIKPPNTSSTTIDFNGSASCNSSTYFCSDSDYSMANQVGRPLTIKGKTTAKSRIVSAIDVGTGQGALTISNVNAPGLQVSISHDIVAKASTVSGIFDTLYVGDDVQKPLTFVGATVRRLIVGNNSQQGFTVNNSKIHEAILGKIQGPIDVINNGKIDTLIITKRANAPVNVNTGGSVGSYALGNNNGTGTGRAPDYTGLQSGCTPAAYFAATSCFCSGYMVPLDASGSRDLNNANSSTSLTYTWSLVSGPGGSFIGQGTPNPWNTTFVPSAPGTYTIRLCVSDTQGGTTSPVDDCADLNFTISACP